MDGDKQDTAVLRGGTDRDNRDCPRWLGDSPRQFNVRKRPKSNAGECRKWWAQGRHESRNGGKADAQLEVGSRVPN